MEETRTSIGIRSDRIAVVRRTWGDGPTLVNVHDNEDAAVLAALDVLPRTGGTLIELRHSGRRRIPFERNGVAYSFDPNRVFSAAGAQKRGAVSPRGKAAIRAARRCAEEFLDVTGIERLSLVVAIHNNTSGEGLTIRAYEDGQHAEYAAEPPYVNPVVSADDFFLVTFREAFEWFRTRGFNVVLQNNDADDDGSLSMRCARQGQRYVNVEAEHGATGRQIAMLEAVASLHREISERSRATV